MTREERTEEQMILRQRRRGDSSPRLVGCGCDGVGAVGRGGGVGGERAEREFCCAAADERTANNDFLNCRHVVLCVASLCLLSRPLPIINHDTKNGGEMNS